MMALVIDVLTEPFDSSPPSFRELRKVPDSNGVASFLGTCRPLDYNIYIGILSTAQTVPRLVLLSHFFILFFIYMFFLFLCFYFAFDHFPRMSNKCFALSGKYFLFGTIFTVIINWIDIWLSIVVLTFSINLIYNNPSHSSSWLCFGLIIFFSLVKWICLLEKQINKKKKLGFVEWRDKNIQFLVYILFNK